jgi:hypothetical protein
MSSADTVQTTAPTEEKPKKRPPHMWVKGQSGNLKGRAKGSRNKSTLATQLACQGILNNEATALVRKALKMALDGDAKCLKLCLERILPPLKEPMEPRHVQHAIEVILKEPLWLTKRITGDDVVTIEANGHGED